MSRRRDDRDLLYGIWIADDFAVIFDRRYRPRWRLTPLEKTGWLVERVLQWEWINFWAAHYFWDDSTPIAERRAASAMLEAGLIERSAVAA
jgi:hypothetical protein